MGCGLGQVPLDMLHADARALKTQVNASLALAHKAAADAGVLAEGGSAASQEVQLMQSRGPVRAAAPPPRTHTHNTTRCIPRCSDPPLM